MEVIDFLSSWFSRRWGTVPALRSVLSHSRLALVRSVYSSVASYHQCMLAGSLVPPTAYSPGVSCRHYSWDGVTRRRGERGGEVWKLLSFSLRGFPAVAGRCLPSEEFCRTAGLGWCARFTRREPRATNEHSSVASCHQLHTRRESRAAIIRGTGSRGGAESAEEGLGSY